MEGKESGAFYGVSPQLFCAFDSLLLAPARKSLPNKTNNHSLYGGEVQRSNCKGNFPTNISTSVKVVKICRATFNELPPLCMEHFVCNCRSLADGGENIFWFNDFLIFPLNWYLSRLILCISAIFAARCISAIESVSDDAYLKRSLSFAHTLFFIRLACSGGKDSLGIAGER